MPINPRYLATFECGKKYHVFNRTHKGLLLFKDDDDYNRFLEKTVKYILPYVEMHSFSLLPNHFHFFFEFKELALEVYSKEFSSPHKFLCEQLRCLFISHTKYMNEKYDRHGGLFSRTFRRIEVDGIEYAKQMILYIHWNHVHHDISNKLEDYQYSSYYEFLCNCPGLVKKETVLEWFGGLENFIKEHKEQESHYLNFKFRME